MEDDTLFMLVGCKIPFLKKTTWITWACYLNI